MTLALNQVSEDDRLEKSVKRLKVALILTHNLPAAVIEVACQGKLSLERGWLSALPRKQTDTEMNCVDAILHRPYDCRVCVWRQSEGRQPRIHSGLTKSRLAGY